jgi:hypothetical protein
MYENYFRWLETEDEYFPYAQYPLQGRWMIYGLGLPDEVLERVYHRNAEALFARFQGGKWAATRGIAGSPRRDTGGQPALDNSKGHP